MGRQNVIEATLYAMDVTLRQHMPSGIQKLKMLLNFENNQKALSKLDEREKAGNERLCRSVIALLQSVQQESGLQKKTFFELLLHAGEWNGNREEEKKRHIQVSNPRAAFWHSLVELGDVDIFTCALGYSGGFARNSNYPKETVDAQYRKMWKAYGAMTMNPETSAMKPLEMQLILRQTPSFMPGVNNMPQLEAHTFEVKDIVSGKGSTLLEVAHGSEFRDFEHGNDIFWLLMATIEPKHLTPEIVSKLK